MPSLNHFRTQVKLFDELAGSACSYARIVSRTPRRSRRRWRSRANMIRPWLALRRRAPDDEGSRDWLTHRVAAWLLREDMGMGVFLLRTARLWAG